MAVRALMCVTSGCRPLGVRGGAVPPSVSRHYRDNEDEQTALYDITGASLLAIEVSATADCGGRIGRVDWRRSGSSGEGGCRGGSSSSSSEGGSREVAEAAAQPTRGGGRGQVGRY